MSMMIIPERCVSHINQIAIQAKIDPDKVTKIEIFHNESDCGVNFFYTTKIKSPATSVEHCPHDYYAYDPPVYEDVSRCESVYLPKCFTVMSLPDVLVGSDARRYYEESYYVVIDDLVSEMLELKKQYQAVTEKARERIKQTILDYGGLMANLNKFAEQRVAV
jgi:hypothetical protein